MTEPLTPDTPLPVELHVHKADRATKEEPPIALLSLFLDKDLPPMDIIGREEWSATYQAEGQALAVLLHDHLPGATWDAMLVSMLTLKITHLRPSNAVLILDSQPDSPAPKEEPNMNHWIKKGLSALGDEIQKERDARDQEAAKASAPGDKAKLIIQRDTLDTLVNICRRLGGK